MLNLLPLISTTSDPVLLAALHTTAMQIVPT
jgi:hypothetical protein